MTPKEKSVLPAVLTDGALYFLQPRGRSHNNYETRKEIQRHLCRPAVEV